MSAASNTVSLISCTSESTYFRKGAKRGGFLARAFIFACGALRKERNKEGGEILAKGGSSRYM